MTLHSSKITLKSFCMQRPYKRVTILTPRCNFFTIYLSESIVNNHYDKPIFMVLNDIMCTHMFMFEFINTPEMDFLSSTSIFILVELPGLEMCANTFEKKNYPKYNHILRDLVIVLNVLGISSVIGIGDGCGSDLLARFALQHPSRVEGLILINFSGNSNLADYLIEKIVRRKMRRPCKRVSKKFQIANEKNLALSDALVKKFSNNINLDNIEQFQVSYSKRSTLSLNDYKGNVMAIVGCTKQIVNSVVKVLAPKDTLIVVENASDVLVENASKVANCIDKFCQNISLFNRHSRYTLFGNISNIAIFSQTSVVNDAGNDLFPTVDVETENCGPVRVHIVGDIKSKSFRTVFLALHDIGCNHSWFRFILSKNQIKELGGNCLFLIVDIPGQGNKCKTLKNFPTLEVLAEDLGAVLKAFDLDQVVCFGDGAGADVAVRVSLQYPTLVSGLILVNFRGNECQLKNRILVDLKSWNYTNGTELKGFPIKYLKQHKFGKHRGSLVQAEQFKEIIKNDLNLRNVQMFVRAFLKRESLKLSAINSNTTIILSEYVTGLQLRYLQQIPTGARVVKLENYGDCLSECPDKIVSQLPHYYAHVNQPEQWINEDELKIKFEETAPS